MDSATERPLAARVYLRDGTGTWHFVRSAAPEGSAVRYEVKNWIRAQSVEYHTTISAHPFVADLPAGRYTLTVERGKEYFPAVREVTIGTDPVEVRVPLVRWIDMAERGWYSGEMHLHRRIEDLRNVVLAEDLDVSFPLTYWITRAFTAPESGDKNVQGEIPEGLVTIDATHVIWPRNTEYEIFKVGGKSHTLGAIFVLNHPGTLSSGIPPVGPVVRPAVARGALLDVDKMDWPFAPILPHATGAQFYELTNNHLWRTEFAFTDWVSPAPPFLLPPYGGQRGGERAWIHYTLGMYYALLDCGFPMLPSAGTANGVHPVPAGFGRVYVHLAGGFDYGAWLEGLRSGRSFVTTGPMIFATVEDRLPGETFRAKDAPCRLRVAGTIRSEQALSFIEVVRDGEPALTIMPQNKPTREGAFESAFAGDLDFTTSGWLAVRTWEDRPEGRVRFAHTAPWRVEIAGRPLRPRAEERAFLLGRMESELERSRALLPAAALGEYEAAIAAVHAIEPRDDSALVLRQARPPRDDEDLRLRLEDMVRYHRFTPEEVRRATGLEPAALEAALVRCGIDRSPVPPTGPDRPLRVIPYPGGRHPRTGFLEGAIDPERETKVSVFTPWDSTSYAIVDVPEAIFSNQGLIYLAHTHIPTVWEAKGTKLPRLEWKRLPSGSLESERVLPDGVAFGAKVVPERTRVRMELWLRNDSAELVRDLRVQNCVMLSAATGFSVQSNQNKFASGPYAVVRSEDGRRWIITGWDPLERTWLNPPVPCMHSDPRIPDCPPGETRRVHGFLSFFEGADIEAELKRIDATDWRKPQGQ